ncbi:tRNA (guanosine(37)-N1)-methyltransferase TrmD [Thiotrichales bacterium 19S11-10]|nr:tRNA (guanosine(37)-N1)-methyltransferase TrmD [Thiotrichales bacterium 19S11-10]
MKFGIISIFPEIIQAALSYGIISRALDKKLVTCDYFNPRDFAEDNYKTIDDRPFGGGPGMVMLYEPIIKAIQAAKEVVGQDAVVVYLSPQGELLEQARLNQFAGDQLSIIFLCGRYEGIDQRIIDEYVDYEISIGDYVLSGGELACAVMLDGMLRLLPKVLNKALSYQEDSFFDGLLDCPHYTRPRVLSSGSKVPDVLLNGNHAEIERWRDMMRLGKTYKVRPELIERRCLSEYERVLLNEYLKKEK